MGEKVRRRRGERGGKGVGGGAVESSGVGLASASRLMEQMGGRLEWRRTGEDFQVTLLFRYV